jgi:uncharacterized surface anchored protein
MAVIKFKKETEGFSIQKDSQPKESFVGCSVQISCDSDSFVVMINNVPYYYEAAKHTFYINDVDVTGNTTVQISDSIRDDVTSGGSGGSGGGVLTSGTLDITGLTTIDLSSVSDNDIVNLTSTNPTETIDSITVIATGKIVRLQPETGLAVTFTGTAVASAGAGDIVLPTSNFVANGTKRDYLSVTKDGSFVKQVDANNFI